MARKVVEVVEVRGPEMFEDVVEEAMRMLESGDELERLETQGMLDGSKTVAKIWIFCWPPEVYVEWVFDDTLAAERTVKGYRSVGIRAWRTSRRFGGRVLPAARVEWTGYYLLGEFFNEAFDVRWSDVDRKMNEVIEKYMVQESKRKALKMLAREFAKMESTR